MNKENMVLREAIKIKKAAEDIIKIEKQERKAKKEALDVEIKNIKEKLAKDLIKITAKGDAEINKEITNIKHIKHLQSFNELEAQKLEKYILKKKEEEAAVSPKDERI